MLAESLLKFLLGGHQPLGHGLLDQGSGIGENGSVCWGRGAEVNAVGAVVAVDVDGLHSSLSSLILYLGQTSVLPRILSGIGKNDLFTSYVEATIPLVVEVDSGRANGIIKDVFAPLKPVVRSKELRSHGNDGVGYLEPAKFCADLPWPLSHVIVDVISSISQDIAVVRSNVTITQDSELVEHWKLLLRSGSSNWHENVTHLLALAVLNGTCNSISNIVHNISDFEVSSTDDRVDVELLIRSKLAWNSLLNVVGDVSDKVNARLTATGGGLVEIVIIEAVVLNNVNDSRWRPGCGGTGVLRLEPGWEGTRVAASNGKPLVDTGTILDFDILIHTLDKVVDISKCLRWVEVLQVRNWPVGEWLGCSIVSVLQNVEQAVQVLADLEWIWPVAGRSAGTLTANIDEHGPCLVIKVLVVDPVPLSEAQVPQGEVVMVQLLREVVLGEVGLKEGVVGWGRTHHQSCQESQGFHY
jgi:hypothetical protein